MYFLWKRTPYGTIRVSGEGLAEFIRSFLSSKFRLYGLAMAAFDFEFDFEFKSGAGAGALEAEIKNPAPREERLVTVILASRDPSDEPKITRRIVTLLKPMGMVASVVWAHRSGPGSAWIEARFNLVRNPWAWMTLASGIALVVIAGWDGLFWTAFWGTAAWFTVRGFTFLLRGKSRFISPGAPTEHEERG